MGRGLLANVYSFPRCYSGLHIFIKSWDPQFFIIQAIFLIYAYIMICEQFIKRVIYYTGQ